MIPLTGNGGLFTRLGKILALVNSINLFRGRGTLRVSSISGSGTVVTVTTVQTTKVAVGDTVTVTGSNISGYNGTFTVASVTSGTQFTLTNTATGTNTSTTVTAFIATGESLLSANSLVDNVWNTFTVAATGFPLDQFLVDTLYSSYARYQGVHTTFQQFLQQTAQNVVVTMANDDTPLAQANLTNALTLLVSQMKSTAASVKTPTTSDVVSGTALAAPVQSAITQTSGGALTAATYYYKVSAVSPTGESAWSNEQSGTTSGGNLTNVISWSAVTGAVGYRVYRGTTTGNENYLITVPQVTGLTFNDNALTYPDDPPATNDGGAGGGTGSQGILPNGLTNNGGQVFASTIVADNGGTSDYVIAEVMNVVCTQDSQSGRLAKGSEQYSVTAPARQNDPLFWNWPQGSGTSTTLTAVNPNLSQSANVLNNSGFETFTANVPNQWTLVVGVAGTTVQAGTSVKANGSTNCLEFIGDSSTLIELEQQFNNSGGTNVRLSPLTTYSGIVWLRLSQTPSAGVFEVSLRDGVENIINDASGTNNKLSITLTGMQPCFYYPFVFHFRTPAVLPSSIFLRLKMTTALSTGTNLFIDDVAMTQPIRLYAGGPTGCVFASSFNFAVVGDSYKLTVGNKYDGQWQQGFQSLFNMTQLDLQIPSSGSPTISDSLLA